MTTELTVERDNFSDLLDMAYKIGNYTEDDLELTIQFNLE